jgi:hypothetical protein
MEVEQQRCWDSNGDEKVMEKIGKEGNGRVRWRSNENGEIMLIGDFSLAELTTIDNRLI